MRRSHGAVVLFTAAFLAAAGCRSFPPPAQAADVPPAPAQQLIVKFKPGTVACDAAGIARLSQAVHVPLEFVRPMSGDACVVRQMAADGYSLERGRELLRQHPAVEWLQPDERMKAL